VMFFSTSLAKEQGCSAIGVVLSGEGSDGALGIQALKQGGGATLAPVPGNLHASPGMPSAPLKPGVWISCCGPNEIARELARLSRHTAPTASVARCAPVIDDDCGTLSAGASRRRSILLLVDSPCGVTSPREQSYGVYTGRSSRFIHAQHPDARTERKIDPSPTAEAIRLTLPARTSPAADTPGTLLSSRYRRTLAGSGVHRPNCSTPRVGSGFSRSRDHRGNEAGPRSQRVFGCAPVIRNTCLRSDQIAVFKALRGGWRTGFCNVPSAIWRTPSCWL